MYKNQKYYFTEPRFPDAVVLKSNKIIKEKINRKPQKIKVVKKDKKEKKKVKGIKELEREKLMKLYGKNNNMIALLILLLKRADNKKDKKQYKSKNIYGRGGWKRKGNNYQTKAQLDKERKEQTSRADKIAKDEKAFKESSKLLKQATNPNISPSQKKLLLEQAEKIASDRITEEEFEKYKGYVSGASAEPPTKKAVLDIKTAVEKEIAKSEEERVRKLKEKQNQGRLQKKLEKEKRYKEFIDDIVFTQLIPKEERDDFFERFKTDNPDITGPSYDGFMKIFNTKYKEFSKDVAKIGQDEAIKKGKVETRKTKMKDFIESIKFTEQPSKRRLKELVAEFKAKHPEVKNQPSKNELLNFVKITSVSDDGSEISQQSKDEYITDFDELVDKTFSNTPDRRNVQDGLESIQEFLTEKELEKSKTGDKELKKKLGSAITYGYEQLSLLTNRAKIIEYLDKSYPIEELNKSKLPDFKDFSVYDDDYENQYLKRIKKYAKRFGRDIPELDYIDIDSDSSESEYDSRSESKLETASEGSSDSSGSEPTEESSTKSSDSAAGVGGDIGSAIKAALGED